MPWNSLMFFSTKQSTPKPYWLLLVISLESTSSPRRPCWAWDWLSNVCILIAVRESGNRLTKTHVTQYEDFLFLRTPNKGLSFYIIAVLSAFVKPWVVSSYQGRLIACISLALHVQYPVSQRSILIYGEDLRPKSRGPFTQTLITLAQRQKGFWAKM